MGFKIVCQVEDFGYFFKITLCTCVFEKSCLKYGISGGNFSFTGPSIVSQSLSRVIPCRLPPGSTEDLRCEAAKRPSLVGRVGWTGGTDGRNIKRVL